MKAIITIISVFFISLAIINVNNENWNFNINTIIENIEDIRPFPQCEINITTLEEYTDNAISNNDGIFTRIGTFFSWLGTFFIAIWNIILYPIKIILWIIELIYIFGFGLFTGERI